MKNILISAFFIMLVLTGCSSTTTTDETNLETLTYQTEKGLIEYKKNPKIYADYNVGELLYLGADVVGADMTYPVKSWSDIAQQKGVVNISGNMEQIAGLKPDLIYTIHEDLYEQYSTISPTIYIPYGTYDPEQLLLELGKIVDKESEAIKWIDNFEAKIKELKGKIDNPELTVSIADAWSGIPTMYGANYGRGGYILYDKLGLSGTIAAENDYIRKDNSYVEVEGERMLQYVGDILFIVDNSQGSVEKIQSLPIYNELQAVKENNVYIIDNDIFGYSDPYSLDKQVEVLKEIYESEQL